MGAGLDPIFNAAEPPDQVSRGGALLWQYFFFPVLMVAAAVGVFVLFGAWGDDAPDEKELLEAVLTGSENAQKQAAQQLAIAIAQARTKADRAARAGETVEPPFYADPAFSARLRHAYSLAQSEQKSEERQRWLAQALGRTADVLSIPLLESTLYAPPGTEPKPTGDLRRAAALGLLFMESRATEAVLVRALTDPDDGEIRSIAANALALFAAVDGGAADALGTREALGKALSDAHTGVQLNAAVGLALRGDAAGLDLLARALTRKGLAELGVKDLDLQRNALLNAVRGVVRLSASPEGSVVARVEALKPQVESLAKDDPDENVRSIARQGLERWRKTG